MAELESVLDGTVISVVPFGAFVDIGSKESGLVHISELSSEYVKDINTFIKKGDRVRVKVIRIDENGKISLSMKQAERPKQERAKRPKPAKVSARPDSYGARVRSRNCRLKTSCRGSNTRVRKRYVTANGVWRISVPADIRAAADICPDTGQNNTQAQKGASESPHQLYRLNSIHKYAV